MSLSVRLLRFGDLTLEPVELGPYVVRGTQDRLTDGPDEPVAGALHLDLGVRPRPMQQHELGTMHQTLTAVEHQFRLRLTPAAERRGPLLGPAHVEDLLAPLDHRAVKVADRRWRHLPRRDRHHGVVEQGHALGDLPEVDEAAALTDPGERPTRGRGSGRRLRQRQRNPSGRPLDRPRTPGGERRHSADIPVPHSPDRARRAVVAPRWIHPPPRASWPLFNRTKADQNAQRAVRATAPSRMHT
jgi:hypothetical protein